MQAKANKPCVIVHRQGSWRRHAGDMVYQAVRPPNLLSHFFMAITCSGERRGTPRVIHAVILLSPSSRASTGSLSSCCLQSVLSKIGSVISPCEGGGVVLLQYRRLSLCRRPKFCGPNCGGAIGFMCVKGHGVKDVITNAALSINLFLPRKTFAFWNGGEAELTFKIHADFIAQHTRRNTSAGTFAHMRL